MTVRWLTAFIDRPAHDFDATIEFWQRATGSTLSPSRGRDGEFATLIPSSGDPYLRVQRIADGPGGCHLDVHVDDIAATTRRAEALGARVHDALDDLVVMSSPAGGVLCVVAHDGEPVRPQPIGQDGRRTIVDQLCLDIGRRDYESECAFWRDLTGWQHRQALLPGFSYLVRPDEMPLRLLLQRTDEEAPVRQAEAHLDLACDDADAACLDHVALGATVRARLEYWITMLDPAGLPYCLTRRNPDTGTLAPPSGG
jgi:predicted enzyme related to lactoylglutathione lyase